MSTNPIPRFSSQEYLALERASPTRNEFYQGEIFAMAGASRAHNLITLNVGGHLNALLAEKPCEVYVSDMRVKVTLEELYTYPDVVVVCGEPVFEDEQGDTLLNPVLLIEVLSHSTKNYDRGEKFELFRMIETFREYLLISQEKCHVEHFVKQSPDQWVLTETNHLESMLSLVTINCELPVRTIYHKVTFPDAAIG